MANNTEQERQRLIAEIDVITDNLLAHGIAAKGSHDDEILRLIEAEATRRAIEELEQIRINNELTRIGKEEIGSRIAELKRQSEGGK